ncbi:Fis family transcriptional regulator [Weissella oryzae SG25]|uniref:Fis family transcriptional regulator n=1 Tax=Weissella oryzae (strain DSM 25784 / JCM 18191 / LMG 30913 / SG25) TaxID=1329250 RepID=A0A069CX13_WEIOS|nr:hypothetical protein [Weissella oryzae]GAK31917.1 Fis family transcriptional regulator [Weissella oryzae SG25]
MRASFIDIRYAHITRRFRYPVNNKEFFNWLMVVGANCVDELALVGYQLPADFVLQDENLKLQDLIPFEDLRMEFSNFEYYMPRKQLLNIMAQ